VRNGDSSRLVQRRQAPRSRARCKQEGRRSYAGECVLLEILLMDGAASRSRWGPSPPGAVSRAGPRTAGAGRVPDPTPAPPFVLAAGRLANPWSGFLLRYKRANHPLASSFFPCDDRWVKISRPPPCVQLIN